MRLSTIAAAVVASLTATIGMAAEPQQFVHDGHTYVYRTAQTANGKIITGRELPRGNPFRLTVRNGRVTGTSGSMPVSFRVREAEGASGGIATASN